MSCPNKPPITPSDTDRTLLVLANKSGTAALILSTSAKVLPPAAAAFAQGLAFGIAAIFRVPASIAAGLEAAIKSQPHNGVIGGVTFNREALAITGGIVQTLTLTAAILGISTGLLGWAKIAAALVGLNALADPEIEAMFKEHLGIDVSKDLFDSPCKNEIKDPFSRAKR